MSPVERRDGPFLRRDEPVAGTRGACREVAPTSSRAQGVLHHAPEACDGIEMVATMGREAREAHRAVVVVEGRVELVRPLEAAAIDAHDHRFASCAEGRQHVMALLTPLLGSNVRDDWREDFGGALVDSADAAAHHATRDAAPRAGRPPRLPWVTFVLCDLALAQRAGGPAIPLGAAPPAQPRQGKAPPQRFSCIEHDALPAPCPGLQGRACQRARGALSRSRSAPSSGTAGASRVFFQRPRTRARPSWRPVCWASTVARSRPLPGEERAPCWRGSCSPRRLRCGSSAPVTVGGRPGARALPPALGPLLGKTLHPCAQGSMRHRAGGGDGGDVVPGDHRRDSVGTAKAPRLLGLLAHGVSGRARMIGKGAVEGAHRLAPWGCLTFVSYVTHGDPCLIGA